MSALLKGLFQASLVICVVLLAGVVLIPLFSRPTGRGPVSVPNPDYRPATVDTRSGAIPAFAHTARELLLIDTVFPDTPVRLAWLQERTAEPMDGGRTVALDAAGGILSYNDRLAPRAHGSSDGNAPLVDVAAAPGGSFWAVNSRNQLLRIDAAGRVASRESLAVFAGVDLVSGPEGELWAIRSLAGFGSIEETVDAPLAVRVGARDALVTPFGAAAAQGEEGRYLANTGAMVVTRDRVFFAPRTRDEIVAFDLDADTVWVTRRGDPGVERVLSIATAQGELPVSFEHFNIGLTLGPDGLLYSLRELVPDHGVDRRVDVYDPATGALLRSGTFSSGWSRSIALDAEGRVYLLDEVRLLTGMSETARRPFPAFDLELIDGGRIDGSVLGGKVTVVNVWASWCGPCREEMPLLKSFERSITHPSFQLLTFNEDVSPAAAALFLNEMNLDFTVALGRGRLKQRFGYWGLPHTVLVDRAGRVVYSWTGFGREQQIQQLRAMVRAELDRRAPP